MTSIGKAFFLFTILLMSCQLVMAQSFTHADTLRGSNGPGRDWWDVLHYDITVKPDFINKSISAMVEMKFKTNNDGNKTMQIDLQKPLLIDSIFFNDTKVDFKNNFNNTWSLYLKDIQSKTYIDKAEGGRGWTSKVQTIIIFYNGKPLEAVRPPWDGGWIWKKDKNANPWMSVACQGLGASVWYPCKDIQSDEPDYGATLNIIVPDSLVGIGNGRLIEKKIMNDGNTKYTWSVINPINNYNIIPYIGKYVHFGETYKGEAGNLDMDYWVLDSNLDKAKEHFKDAPRMMKAFEYWFGPYPFYEDGYKLVDAPHLGMEHQSATAYGNEYKNGYLGTDRSGSGWGLKWDFIIVHESGHEWFANNITAKDMADNWVHEGFTSYSEVLFTEYYYGKEAATAYVTGVRKRIRNDTPIIGPYGVNKDGSGDMYNKGSNLIHTIRQVINNDVLFRKILRGLNKTFYHQTVTSKQIEDYISKQSKINFSKVFDQYLRTTQVPTLEYKLNGYKLQYRYSNCIKGFNLPLKIKFKGDKWIRPIQSWQTLSLYREGDNNFSVDPNFYINTKKVE